MGTWSLPLVALLTLGLVGTSEPPPVDTEDRSAAAPVVRVTLALVQVDAVVTDKSGRHVTDLKAEDFEIFEDGRAQEITNCAYVSIPPLTTVTVSPPTTSVPTPPPPPTRLRREEVRRTFALVVDDLGLSFRGTIDVRKALEKFLEKQMEPGDLVAIVRTGGGMGTLQQFTTSKEQLRAAIERVRFNAALSRFGADSFAPVGEGKNVIDAGGGPRGGKPAAGSAVDALREAALSAATLASVKFVIQGLGTLPGRKAVVLFSDGVRLAQTTSERFSIAAPGSRGGPGGSSTSRADLPRVGREYDPMVEAALGSLIDFANRASVVLYTVDTRGLSPLALNAADDVNTLLGIADVRDADIRTHSDARRRDNFENEEGLRYMAQETGGFLLRNQNDLSKSLERVLEDQRGYYLIGYVPDPSTFKAERNRSFHRITVKVNRPGVDVRSRAGFYGATDADTLPTAPAGAGALVLALASPFASGDIHLQLTSLFVHEPQKGSVLRSLLHVDTRDLSLRDALGSWKANIEILAVTFGDNGVVVDQIGRPQEISVAAEQLERALGEGLTYTVDVPVKQPGAYQLRVAVRDTATGRVGSASQLVQVPDLGDKRLALSGILVGGLRTAGAAGVASEPEATAALRRFRPGGGLSYSFAVYNAHLDRATGRPRLDAQMRLFRDGQPLKTGEVRPIEVGEDSDVRMVTSGGALVLGPGMPPGDYVLQVIVTDTLSRKKSATATQAIDFEVRP